MVRVGVSSMFLHEYPLGEGFDLVREAGLATIEFWMETPHFWLRGCPVDEFSACLDEYPGFRPIGVHAPVLDLNPCSINPEVAEISVRYSLAAIEFGEQVGAGVVTLHPGGRTVRRSPNAHDIARFRRFRERIRTASEGRRAKIALENMEPKINAFLSNPEEMALFLGQENWSFFTLDVAHALARGTAEACEFIRLGGDRLVNVHLSGRSGEVPHLPPSRDPRVALVMEVLRESGYDGMVTLELEDQAFLHELSGEEKLSLLMGELAYVEERLG